MCAPPIPRMRFAQRTPFVARELPLFERQAFLCLALGFVRSYLNQTANLGDFMGGGTDLFAALLALLATNDCCMMNGSFLIMFLVWALTNAVFFNMLLSLGGNLYHPDYFLNSSDPWRPAAFLADSVLIIINSTLQGYMCLRAHKILDEVLPNWQSQMAWGDGGPPTASAAQQPLLGPGANASRSAQPTGRPNFQIFGGGGQRLGGVAGGGGVNPNGDTRPM
ncbi:unnamed protein product [Polarella glacialis]|uniref:Uncharacterized protein n=1 Tax=Polarella glacialis TaxID=89957 RepID=A0A813K6W4_POLGL|nr:unnamed protein product [Polarella glacialis]